MLEVDATDPWFKRHFALLVMRVLIDTMVNDYVNQNYIDHLQDVGNIANLNWCQMVINALITSKLVWTKSTDKIYGGKILFLRTHCAKKRPVFKTWTFKLFLKRERDELQSGGFGYKHIGSALQLENAPPEEENSNPQSDVPHPPQLEGESSPMPEGLQAKETQVEDAAMDEDGRMGYEQNVETTINYVK
nr:uncharacterized protein LOC109191529 [Ipomoea trifida]